MQNYVSILFYMQPNSPQQRTYCSPSKCSQGTKGSFTQCTYACFFPLLLLLLLKWRILVILSRRGLYDYSLSSAFSVCFSCLNSISKKKKILTKSPVTPLWGPPKRAFQGRMRMGRKQTHAWVKRVAKINFIVFQVGTFRAVRLENQRQKIIKIFTCKTKQFDIIRISPN